MLGQEIHFNNTNVIVNGINTCFLLYKKLFNFSSPSLLTHYDSLTAMQMLELTEVNPSV